MTWVPAHSLLVVSVSFHRPLLRDIIFIKSIPRQILSPQSLSTTGEGPGTYHLGTKGYKHLFKLYRNSTTKNLQWPWEETYAGESPGPWVCWAPQWTYTWLLLQESTLYFRPLSPHSRTNTISLWLSLSCPLQYDQLSTYSSARTQGSPNSTSKIFRNNNNNKI